MDDTFQPAGLAIDVAVTAERTTVKVGGELDMATGPDLRQVLTGLVDSGDLAAVVTLDVSGVSFIDSTGLSILAAFYKRAGGAGATVTIRSPTAAVRKVLDLTGFSALMAIEEPAPSDG